MVYAVYKPDGATRCEIAHTLRVKGGEMTMAQRGRSRRLKPRLDGLSAAKSICAEWGLSDESEGWAILLNRLTFRRNARWWDVAQ